MKYCSNCGMQLPDESRFCFSCGAAVVTNAPIPPTPQAVPPAAPAPAATPPPPPSMPAPNLTGQKQQQKSYDNEELMQGVHLCSDGKYRWMYAVNMWKNPSILILVFKIFFWVIVGIWGLMMVITLIEDGWDGERIWDTTLIFLILIGVFTILILISYAIMAAIYGGKYTLLFEMDEQHIAQILSQANKAQAIGMLTAAVGILSGKPAMVGLGVASAARNDMSSQFSNVRSVKPCRSRNLIKVNELFTKNQVYVRDEDFDFVYNYIRDHCPRVK